MGMTLLDALLRTADAFAEARGLSASRVSTLVFGDGKVIDRLRSGRDITTQRYESAMLWFSENWPAGAAWPVDVPRPVPPPSDETLADTAPSAAASVGGAPSSFTEAAE